MFLTKIVGWFGGNASLVKIAVIYLSIYTP